MLMLDAKKDYKYFCRKCKLKYKYDQGKNMNEMRKQQPREFWRLFKNKSNTETGHEISLDDFCHYFRSLASEETPFENPGVNDFLNNFDNANDSTFSELDEPFTQEEIRKAAMHLKPNKACSLDTILNEYLK